MIQTSLDTENGGVLRSLGAFFKELFREAVDISFTLFKIMVPVIVAVKVLQELGLVDLLGSVLAPVMQVVGLPGSMGLVWATTLLTNLYGGVAVFVSLCADNPLTTAQVTVLASMMLIAHGLPIELRIAQAAGAGLIAMGILRVGGAMLYGGIFWRICRGGSWLQDTHHMNWIPAVSDQSLSIWLLGQLKGLCMIFVIVLGLLGLMKVLKRMGFMDLITRLLHPVLNLLGIGREASAITLIGMTLGLAYGGGLIIREAASNVVPRQDVFFSLTLMGLCHSLIEDTLLMALIGGHLSGILWGRVLFSALTVFLFVKLFAVLPGPVVERFFMVPGTSGKEGSR